MKHYPQSNVSSQLDSCSICGQILARMDKRIHSQTHALDSDFPSLWQISKEYIFSMFYDGLTLWALSRFESFNFLALLSKIPKTTLFRKIPVPVNLWANSGRGRIKQSNAHAWFWFSFSMTSKGTSQPGLRLVPSGNFLLALNISHQFLIKYVRI